MNMNYRRFLLVLGTILLVAAAVSAQTSAPPPVKPAKTLDRPAYALPNFVTKAWTGDLDGMIKRRMIRVLVPYSKTFYFVDRGNQRGLTYEAFRIFEEDLNKKLKSRNIRVHVVFEPTARDKLIPFLVEGRGDIAAGNLTITPERLKQVDFSDSIRRDLSEIVVTGPGVDTIATAQDLSGKEVYVRKSSSFFESVEQLNAELAKAGKALAKVRFAPENLETEDVLEMVNAGLVKITVADEHIAEFWAKVFPKLTLNKGAAVRTGGDTAWMIRKDSPQLKAELNAVLARYPEGSNMRNTLFQKYLQNTKFAREATSKEEVAKFARTVDFFRKYGNQYNLDYLLMMAQGYQESQLNQQAKSPVGAIGVMQVMPTTGGDLKVGDIRQIEPNIHAGVKYIRFMMDQFYANEPMTELSKGLFTFASYNAGPGRVAQLRKLAAQRGLDPNVWFNNVEVVASEKIGRETVQYVSNIYKYYLAYQMIEEQRAEREKAKEAVKGEADK
jgi:membrane-bound lytic murein transglycosylase MltF